MINFRYHVVSLTAVFLALAIGLVVGTAALNGPVADSLKDNVNALRKDNQQMRQTVASLERELTIEEDFAAEAAPLLLGDTLTERRVLVVSLPSGREHTDGVIEKLALTGATLTGRIDVQDKFIDPDSSEELLETAVRAQQPTLPTSGLPGNSSGVETSTALLASALLDRPQAPAVTAQDRAALIQVFQAAGYLVTARVTGPAEAVVLVSGRPYVDRDGPEKDQSVVRIAEQFDAVAALVVAGSGTTEGNLVAEVRRDPTLSRTISTVDNANTTQGQVVSALATAEQVVGRKVGQYGLGEGAASLMPGRLGG